MLFSTDTLFAMGLIFVGSFVQTAIGFGLAVVAAPLLFLLSPNLVPAPITFCALFISILSAVKYRQNIEIGGLKLALYGRIPGSIAGGVLLLVVSTQLLSLWIGLLVLFAVLVSLLPFRIEPTPGRMVTAGLCSGFFGTSSAIGGPPMALLLQHQEANQLRGNLSAFFVASSIISLTVQFAVGYVTLFHLKISLLLLPAAWLGYKVASLTTAHLPKSIIRYGSLLLCFVSGLTAVWQGLQG